MEFHVLASGSKGNATFVYEDGCGILICLLYTSKELVDQYEVKGYPTLILLKDGQEVKRMQGLQQKLSLIHI